MYVFVCVCVCVCVSVCASTIWTTSASLVVTTAASSCWASKCSTSRATHHFWSGECVAFNYRWLTEELQIDPEEITFIEDVWAGGGNLGPSIEYFVGGLELGNMVFMQSESALHNCTAQLCASTTACTSHRHNQYGSYQPCC